MNPTSRKNQIRDEIVNSFRTLKEYINIHSNNEKILQTIILQLAETIANSEYSYIHPEDEKIYRNYLVNNQIKKQEEKALYEVMFHRGALS